MSTTIEVKVAPAFSVFYWLITIAIALTGLGAPIAFFMAWYKIAVINRTKVVFEQGSDRIRYFRGRWLVKDDDLVPVKSVDNVMLDRSIFGKLFGWCTVRVATRASVFRVKHASTVSAELFREAFLDRA